MVSLVSLNQAALRGGALLPAMSSVFGGKALLTHDQLSDSATVIRLLRDAIIEHRTRVVELFHEWDSNGDGKVSREDFRRGLTMLVEGTPSDSNIDALFDELDVGKRGVLEYRKLHQMLAPERNNGSRGAQQPGGSNASHNYPSPQWTTKAAPSTHVAGGTKRFDRHHKHPGVDASSIALARAEAVLLGQIPPLPRQSQLLLKTDKRNIITGLARKPASYSTTSQRRIKSLGRLIKDIGRASELEGERREGLARQRAQEEMEMPEARIRRQRSEAAEVRKQESLSYLLPLQASASSASHLHNHRTLPRTLSLESAIFAPASAAADASPRMSDSMGSLRTPSTRGTGVEPFHSSTPGLFAAGDSEAISRIATAIMPYASIAARSGFLEASLPNSDAEAERKTEAAAAGATGAPGASWMLDAGTGAASPRMIFREDFHPPITMPPPAGQHGAAQLKLSALHKVGGHHIRAPGSQAATTQSSHVASLRAPGGVPHLPRPKNSEAVRSGVYSRFIPKQRVHEAYTTGKFSNQSNELVQKQVAARVSASKERLAAKMAVMGYGDDLTSPEKPKEKPRSAAGRGR